jgi:hypothetical protein
MLESSVDVAASLERMLSGKEKAFFYPQGDFTHAVMVNAQTLSEHIDVNRSEFLPWLPETLSDPYELWLSFERHKGTGKIALRQRMIKGFDDGKGKAMLAVFQARNGFMESWTMMPTSDMKYVNSQRQGKLIYKRN